MNRHRLGLGLFVAATVAAFANIIVAWLLAAIACGLLAWDAATRRAAGISLAILAVSATLALGLNGVVVGGFGGTLLATEGSGGGRFAEAAALAGLIAPWVAASAFAISRDRSRRLAVAGGLTILFFEIIPIVSIQVYSIMHDGAMAPSWLFAAQLPALIGLGLIVIALGQDWRGSPPIAHSGY